MTKQELVDKLSHWPDDATVEIVVQQDPYNENPWITEMIWLELEMVEEPNLGSNDHCLLYGGRITMG